MEKNCLSAIHDVFVKRGEVDEGSHLVEIDIEVSDAGKVALTELIAVQSDEADLSLCQSAEA